MASFRSSSAGAFISETSVLVALQENVDIYSAFGGGATCLLRPKTALGTQPLQHIKITSMSGHTAGHLGMQRQSISHLSSKNHGVLGPTTSFLSHSLQDIQVLPARSHGARCLIPETSVFVGTA